MKNWLAVLSPAKLAELRDNGALSQIYAHLTSLNAWQGLVLQSMARHAEETAALIRASPLAAHTIAALDVWALAAFMTNRGPLQEKLLLIARLADPDPKWGDRFQNSSKSDRYPKYAGS